MIQEEEPAEVSTGAPRRGEDQPGGAAGSDSMGVTTFCYQGWTLGADRVHRGEEDREDREDRGHGGDSGRAPRTNGRGREPGKKDKGYYPPATPKTTIV